MTQFERAGSWLSWVIVPVVLVMQFFDLKSGIDGGSSLYSVYLIGFSALAIIFLPWTIKNLRTLPKSALWVLGLWITILLFALVSSSMTRLPRIVVYAADRWSLTVSREYLVVPVITALVTTLAAVGLVLATPVAERWHRVWVTSLIIVGTSPLAWARSALAAYRPRLVTGIGGAASIHVVLLLALGCFISAIWVDYHRRWSLLAAAIATVEIILTQSRAGLICLGLLLAIVLVKVARRSKKLGRKLIRIGGIALVGVAVLAFTMAERLLETTDIVRQLNTRNVFAALNSPVEWVFGVGSGRLWPWAIYDAGVVPSPFIGMVLHRDYGWLATNPHSVYLGLLAELGIIGLLLFLALATIILARAGRQPDGYQIVGITVAVTLVAFVFDHYLLKNFGVSFVWWFFAFAWLSVKQLPLQESSSKEVTDVFELSVRNLSTDEPAVSESSSDMSMVNGSVNQLAQ